MSLYSRAFLSAVLLAMSATASIAGGLPPVLRAPAAVLLRPEPGPLTITISKRDLNIYQGADTLTAVLVDPQRQTIATVTLPDDGDETPSGKGKAPQSETIRATCDAPGIYRLMIRPSGDLVYGFETNCAHYVLEGGLVFNDGSIGGKVYFKPPTGALKVAAAALHNPGKQKLPLLDAAGATVRTFDLTQDAKPNDLFGDRRSGGYVSGEKAQIPANAGNRSGLWAFDISRMDLRLQVEGLDYWTNDPRAWFDASKSRWMLLPYAATRYLQPGEKAPMTFRLLNSTGAPGRFFLTTASQDGLVVRLVGPPSPVSVAPKAEQEVQIQVSLPANAPGDRPLRGVLVAQHESNPDGVACAGIVVRRSEAPAHRPLAMPIVLKPYQHENMLFGYAPDYVTNEVHFGLGNRPYIRQRTEDPYTCTGLTLLTDKGWIERPFMDLIRRTYPGYAQTVYGGGFLGAKIAFDSQGGVYTLLKIRLKDGRQPALLIFTPDQGQTYSLQEINTTVFDIEQFTGHNALDIPPPVLGYRFTRPHHATFCGYFDLELYMPQRDGDKLDLGKPVLVSDNCLGSCEHSGGPGSLVTRDGKTHIVWGEVAPDDAPGVPTYIATYDHATRTVNRARPAVKDRSGRPAVGRPPDGPGPRSAGKKVLLAYGPPVNDVHNVPAITMDSEGYLHVLTGAHGDQFKYLRSLKPNDAYSGFTEPVPILDAGYVDDKTGPKGTGRQTYISLVCGPDDTLYTAYRQWRRNVDNYHGDLNYAALSFQSKPKNGPWGPAQPLVIPPVPGYSIYYHKLTIDRRGRLFLSYSHWTEDKTYQDDFPGRYNHSAILMSPDGGKTWKLAETRDFADGLK